MAKPMTRAALSSYKSNRVRIAKKVKGQKGRAPYKPTAAQRRKVVLLKSTGWSDQDLADHFEMDRGVFSHHFAYELKHGRAEKMAEVLGWLDDLAQKNSGALRLLIQRLDLGDQVSPANLRQRLLQGRKLNEPASGENATGSLPSQDPSSSDAVALPQKKPPKLGKKQEEAAAALKPDNSTRLGSLLGLRQTSLEPRGKLN